MTDQLTDVDQLPPKGRVDPSVALAILRGIVSYWNEFGPVGIDELMHHADRYLRERATTETTGEPRE